MRLNVAVRRVPNGLNFAYGLVSAMALKRLV